MDAGSYRDSVSCHNQAARWTLGVERDDRFLYMSSARLQFLAVLHSFSTSAMLI